MEITSTNFLECDPYCVLNGVTGKLFISTNKQSTAVDICPTNLARLMANHAACFFFDQPISLAKFIS